MQVLAMSNQKKPPLTTEVGFCPHCGAILPLPVDSLQTYIKCICEYKIPCSKFHNMVVSKAEIVFNKIKESKSKRKGTSEGMLGPTIERICAKCGHNEMTYKTQQMRSADEGMSIFYYCVKCGSLEKEDS